MAKPPKEPAEEVAKRRDAILKKMLETPPKPHAGKPSSSKKAGPRRDRPGSEEKKRG
jgi:hypothetical protein